MNIALFFDPLNDLPGIDSLPPDALFHCIECYGEKQPAWQKSHLAIIGIPEERGTHSNKGTKIGPAEVRQKLYALKKPVASCRITDLGNLRCGVDLQQTYLRIREVCESLMQHGVIPVLVGGSHDLMYGQYLAYESLGDPVSVLNVDALLDMDHTPKVAEHERHLLDVLMHEPNYLSTFTQLAYQRYLTSPDALAILETLGFEAYRLGQLRDNFREVEPVIREADMLSFDITAIKMTDAPGNANAHAFGLTAEEACQLCWYAGINDKLSSAGFYEYNPLHDQRGQTAEMVATMIWYLMEGFYHRKHESLVDETTHTRYTVPFSSRSDVSLIFYKSQRSEKWWMEVPNPRHPGKMAVVPCSYTDYESATRGELPQRWINRYARLG